MVQYNNINTTSGQMGSPIFLQNTKNKVLFGNINQELGTKYERCQIGVHYG